MAKTEKKQLTNRTGGKNKIRTRAGDWVFLVRGKGKPQGQKPKQSQ